MDHDQDDALVTPALRALAGHDELDLRSAPRVESALREHVRALASARARRRYAMLATAAMLVGVAWLATWYSPEQVPSTNARIAFTAAPAEVATDFLPLTYSSLPHEEGEVVRIEVPRAALTAFGLGFGSPELAEGTILADVLVGEDGLARAVRFVRASE